MIITLKKIFLFAVLFFALIAKSELAKSQYVLLEAEKEFKLLHYNNAIKLYTEAYQKKATLKAIERLATCYRLTKDYQQAESWYALLTQTKGAKPDAFLYYGDALRNNSKFSEAKIQYEKYGNLDKNISLAQKNMLLLSCDSALSWMNKPKSVSINNEVNLNTEYEDWGAVKYQNAIVFTSDRKAKIDTEPVKDDKPFLKFDNANQLPDKVIYGWTGNNYLKLYKKTTEPTSLFPFEAGSDYHVGAASFTADGNEMYFTLTKIPSVIEREKGIPKTIKVEIYSSKKDANGNWGTPLSFKYNNVNVYSVGDPFISKNGNELYFVSDMPGGKGKTDIYVCTKTTEGNWGPAINLEELNSEGAERTPFIDNENNFYFATDGRIGMGGLDIFKSLKNGHDFSVPQNMGYPLNSPQDEFAFTLNNQKEGMFSSDRTGGRGSDDIYNFVLDYYLTFKLEGIATDKVTKQPLANVIVSLSKTDGTKVMAQTDNYGYYSFNLQNNADYYLRGSKTGFFNTEAKFISSMGLTKSAVLKQDLVLDQITLFKEIRLEKIYYDLAKSDIRPEAAIELDKLVEILKENPSIWIELGSHTDSRADDNYNMKLSQARAEAAVQYMVNKGIDRFRLLAKGYGETRLLNDCTNGKQCTEEEHQLNRRTEFKIVKQ